MIAKELVSRIDSTDYEDMVDKILDGRNTFGEVVDTARLSGLVILCGVSDDTVILDGAIKDET